ncbi:hypothetical protein A0H81_07443 [Grifola frondosa]|uniref:F-box domain-containing protein n=1 Tax=Grifola frondosa TaxID=5627 RepID=A0A1C7M6U7_GRIFR|nr:hypothetical protein A0H81_07443 [Grifola frondosa]
MRQRPCLPVPTELTVKILVNLDFRDISKCRAISKTFNIIIEATAALQYTIKLGLAGFVDGRLDSPMSILERSEEFFRQQKAWSNLHLTLQNSVELDSNLQWDCRRAHREAILGFRKDAGHSSQPGFTALDVISLRGPKNDRQFCSTLRFEYLFEKAWANSPEDLLILQEPHHGVNQLGLKILSLRDGSPHSRAHSSRVAFSLPHWVLSPFIAQLRFHGDMLAISIRVSTRADLILYNWVAGLSLILPGSANIEYTDAHLKPDGLLFLSSVQTSPRLSVSIQVLSVKYPLLDSAPQLLATLGLPPLVDGIRSLVDCLFISVDGLFSEPEKTSPRASFRPSDVLVGLELQYKRVSYHTYILLPTLLSVIGHRCSASFPDGILPWHLWGPQCTRIFKHDSQSDPVSIYAYRAVSGTKVYDFNPGYHAQGAPFSGPVTTCLPYRVAKLDFARPMDSNDSVWMFEDADGFKFARLRSDAGRPTQLDLHALRVISLT